ncbi:MAG: ABC transporter permease [Chlamydiae bacterium]|nr:ABC transporter permease [Chlamydiota bacterium]MBI3266092.1 ABC transporter permease [Chlamydiota bacterium]
MKNYFLKKLSSSVFVLLGTLLLTFILIQAIPGDPIQNFIGQRADLETIAHLKQEWGLDQSIPYQFMKYIGRTLQGNLGQSYFTHESVLNNLLERLPVTALLAALAILIGALIGIPFGILSATYPNTFLAKMLLFLTLLGSSLPVFWAGVLILIAVSKIKMLDATNSLSPLAINLFLAALVLGIRPWAMLARVTQSQMGEVLQEDYILSAWARGLSKKRIILNHALRNCWAPILTALALDFGSLLSGAAITETIFGIPGMGKFALTGLARRDYPVIMGMVLFSALIFISINFLTDLMLPILDPKIKRNNSPNPS